MRLGDGFPPHAGDVAGALAQAEQGRLVDHGDRIERVGVERKRPASACPHWNGIGLTILDANQDTTCASYFEPWCNRATSPMMVEMATTLRTEA